MSGHLVSRAAIVDSSAATNEALALLLRRSQSSPIYDLAEGQSDGNRLALVVEGGGMRGTVSGGMCVALEQLGLLRYIDIFVGTSAGAINTVYSAADQATYGSTIYSDFMWFSEFVKYERFLIGKPAMSLEFLLDEVAHNERPLDVARVEARSPNVGFVATNIDTGGAHLFRDWKSEQDLWRSLRASCSFPGVTGPPIAIGNEEYVDGTLAESIPIHSAIEMGATHLIVLRTRPGSQRKANRGRLVSGLSDVFLRLHDKRLPRLEEGRADRYNETLETLESWEAEGRAFSFHPAEDAHIPGQLENSRKAILGGLEAGARSVFASLCQEPVQVLQIFQGLDWAAMVGSDS